MATWQLQEAKAKLSEVIDTAEKQGPQVITRRGVKSAVVVPFAEWEKSQGPTPVQRPQTVATNDDFLKFLRSAPDFEIPDRHAERIAARSAALGLKRRKRA